MQPPTDAPGGRGERLGDRLAGMPSSAPDAAMPPPPTADLSGARDAAPPGVPRGGAHLEERPDLPAGPGETRSLGDIVGDIAGDLTTLVKQQLDLAKAEAKTEAAKAGKGAGFLAGAGVAAHLMLLFVSLALMFLLGSWMDLGWAALIVGVLWAVAAALLAQTGRRELMTMNPTLETTQRTLKEDVQWAKQMKPE
ncbi:phage holin family protein [Nocardioides daeguensis]|uniref:Phage holin family protein n=1 Tax=Nocardioides daeguensis TaxID=908359 RepID=A0ABP6UZA8_9ACTN|nr:phage holin family protein [Nocardioides daeguensis]